MTTQRIQFKEWLPDQPSVLDAAGRSSTNNATTLFNTAGTFSL